MICFIMHQLGDAASTWRCDFISDSEESAISTIVIRGSTENVMDDIERAIDDGVNTFKALTKVLMIILIQIH